MFAWRFSAGGKAFLHQRLKRLRKKSFRESGAVTGAKEDAGKVRLEVAALTKVRAAGQK